MSKIIAGGHATFGFISSVARNPPYLSTYQRQVNSIYNDCYDNFRLNVRTFLLEFCPTCLEEGVETVAPGEDSGYICYCCGEKYE